ncbi:uncharacterized protein TNCV_799861 [Trichonephila clavipes]|nr:uncharacterized protein TNCV_799861 [Trichonephila clavipes]
MVIIATPLKTTKRKSPINNFITIEKYAYEGRKVRSGYLPFRTRVLNRPRQNDRLRVMLVLVHIDITPPFASARCMEIACGTIATPTSARIVERVTVGSTSACHTILRSSLLVVFPVAPDPVFRAWVPSRVHCSQQFLTTHSERSTWPATWRVDQRAVFIPMIRPLSNSLNCEKCLLARLPGMFLLLKSSYNRRVIVTFMNLRICSGLYNTLFLIVAPPRRV